MPSNMNFRRMRHILLSLLTVCAVIVCVFAFFSRQWKTISLFEKTVSLNPGWDMVNPSPTSPEGTVAVERSFSLLELQSANGGTTLFFRTVNMRVVVRVNGNYLYSYGFLDKSYVGSECGSALHFVRLAHFYPGDNFTVNIEFSPAFQPKENGFFKHGRQTLITPEIYFGSKAACMQKYIGGCIVPALISFIIIMLGCLYLLLTGTFWFVQKQYTRNFCYWGVFSIIVGIGFFLESGFADLLIPHVFINYFASTLILAILPDLFLMYVRTSKLVASYTKMGTFFIWQSIANAFMVCVCAFIPSLPFSYVRDYIIITHAVYLFFVIAIILNDCAVRGRMPNLPSALIILTSVALLIDFTLYLFPPYRVDLFTFSRFFMLAYLILRTVEVISDFYSTQILSAREDMYRTVVVRDSLTNVMTRSAFWRFQKDFFAKNKTINNRFTLVLCEIANLRNINDKEGFEEGDEVLKTVSQILRLHFVQENVYRLNGSCFGVVLIDIPYDVVTRNVEEIEKTMADYNSIQDFGTIQLAITVGMFNTVQDKSFDAFLSKMHQRLTEQSRSLLEKIK